MNPISNKLSPLGKNKEYFLLLERYIFHGSLQSINLSIAGGLDDSRHAEGVQNLDSGVGVYAPDAEAYEVFGPLFDPIIDEYHGGFPPSASQPPVDFGNLDIFDDLDPDGKFVISTRVRCGRSVEGFPFNPMLTEKKHMRDKFQRSFYFSICLAFHTNNLLMPLMPWKIYWEGSFCAVKTVGNCLKNERYALKESTLMNPDSAIMFLKAANACRFWPVGRGIFHNDDKTFLVWVNEEDHLRIISMEQGGDIRLVYSRLVLGLRFIGQGIAFSRSNRLGYLTFCPTNLGTTIRASVHIKLPNLAADLARLEEVASEYNLQVRGTAGEHSESKGGVYDISNRRRLGLTEFEAVWEMQVGIRKLIQMEESLIAAKAVETKDVEVETSPQPQDTELETVEETEET
ncbi:F46H5.3 [Cordylochernes scorpioides]|uniref:arginine kinase n=1 Tax=Cordylochernes scorpioides TaxID=51811 RepID=A0ABY6LDV9_9ARAC|nr:F46H5.3 [Cordylochernes scorpioides]